MEILLPSLCCWGSTTATPGQSSEGTQPHRSSFFSNHQEIPSTRDMCRRSPARGRCAGLSQLRRHVEPENVLGRCSAAKQSTDAEQGFSKRSFLQESFSCCRSCQAAPRGQRQLQSRSARSSGCCPQRSSGRRAPRIFTTTSSDCSAVSTEL